MELPAEYIRFELSGGLGVLTHMPLMIQFYHDPWMPREDYDRELLDWLRRFDLHLPVLVCSGAKVRNQLGTVQSLIARVEQSKPGQPPLTSYTSG